MEGPRQRGFLVVRYGWREAPWLALSSNKGHLDNRADCGGWYAGLGDGIGRVLAGLLSKTKVPRVAAMAAAVFCPAGRSE